MERLFNTLILLILSIYCHSQIEISTPKIIPTSPNAASLGIFGDIPVGHYTGIPNIVIPLYKIELDGMEIPISLNYHASGVKVAQDASWVGMGWALNAGGCIAKNIQGWDDFELTPTGYFYKNALPENPGSPFISANNIQILEFIDILNDRVDACPDIYSFNFCSYSGTCFLPRRIDNPGQLNTPQALVRNLQQYLHIEKRGNNIVVTDGNGFKFYFGTQETTKTYSTSTNSRYNRYLDYVNNKKNIPVKGLQNEVTTAWLLDSIVSSKHNKISFLYKEEYVSTPVFLSESTDEMINLLYITGNPYIENLSSNSSYTYSTIKQKILSQINYKNLSIDFQTTERYDIEPANSAYKPQKLSYIIIKSSNDVIKKIGFDYSYIGAVNNYNNCRLFLSSVYELPNEQKSDRKYMFSYITPEKLPAKTTTLIDYWGFAKDPLTPLCYCWSTIYQEGDRSKSRTLIPPTIIRSDNSTKYYYGQDRTPNSSMLTYGTLQSIKYPTGGKTIFTYEPHEYDNAFHVDTEIEQTSKLSFDDVYMHSSSSIDTQDNFINGGLSGDLFTLDSEKTIYIRLKIDYMLNETPLDLLYHGYEVRIQKKQGNSYSTVYTIFYPDAHEGPIMPQWKDWHYTLTAGTYKLSINRNFSFSSLPNTEYQAQGEVKLSIYTGSPVMCNTGAGIRIKEILNESEGLQIQKRKFIYKNGLLMSEPRFHYIWNVSHFEMNDDGIHQYQAQYIHGTSSSLIPYSNSASGTPVGYGCVSEELWDTTFKGATSYYFNNEADEINPEYLSIIPNIPLLSHTNNGLLTAKYYIDNSKRILRQEEYTYSNVELRAITGLKMFAPPMENQHFGLYYYNIPSEWWKLDSQTVTEYHGNKKHSKTTDYLYNNVNYLPSCIQKRNSDGRLSIHNITYANSSSIGILGKMQTAHMFNIPIEETESINTSIVSRKIHTYKEEQNRILLQDLSVAKGNTTPQLRIKYLNYDCYGNIAYYIKDNIEHVVYLWGYNGQYPIAKIENATYSAVQTALSGVTPDALAKQPHPNMDQVNALRTALPKALIHTYTYRPHVGIIAETDSKNVTIHYEYDSMNRLKYIRDMYGNILKSFDYQYKH